MIKKIVKIIGTIIMTGIGAILTFATARLTFENAKYASDKLDKSIQDNTDKAVDKFIDTDC